MIGQGISMIPPGGARAVRTCARVSALTVICLAALAIPGCGPPKLDPQEYGELITDLPRLPETEKPYRLPEIEKSPDKSSNAESSDEK
jgi:hypothetical protein